MNFKEEYQKRIESIESILEKYLPVQEGYQKIIMEAMEYSLMAGGKRLRPMLMKESFTLFGGEGEIIEPFMAAIEMIHTYSLVHDDLPAMDNDEYRRGRKTTHVVYGEDMGILAGDALLNYAFETACRAFDIAPEQSSCIGQALKILAGKAGIYGMIGGQVADVVIRRKWRRSRAGSDWRSRSRMTFWMLRALQKYWASRYTVMKRTRRQRM